MSQTAEKIAEYLYGHTRAKAIEWAKTEKFDSRYHQAEEILELIGFESLRKQLADCEEAVDLIAQLNAELEEDNQRKKDHIAHFRRQLAESQARDAVRIEALEIASDFLADRMHTAPINRIDRALAMPSDSTALDEAIRRAVEDERQKWPEVSHSEAIRQAKREALLEAAKFFDTRMLPYPEDHLRRMADELEEKKA